VSGLRDIARRVGPGPEGSVQAPIDLEFWLLRPRAYRVGNKMVVECGREHLDGFARYAELADAIARWLEETRR